MNIAVKQVNVAAEAAAILGKLGVDNALYVDGDMASFSPVTGEQIGALRTVSASEAAAAIAKAHEAFRAWRLVPAPRRGELVRLLGEELRAAKADLAGKIVLCPPGALNDRWSRRLPDPVTAMASGWMRVRQRARQRNVELPLILSDHADWDELTETIRELSPKEVWVTHGREDALVHWCATHQIKARALALVGFEDEDD